MVTERIADRAAELWVRMLRKPKYDNLGNTGSPRGRARDVIAQELVAVLPNNATEERLAKFKEALKKTLLDENILEYRRNTLCVDYGPDGTLDEAAQVAGLEMEFPWKTTMFLNENCVAVSYGYGAEYVYHYSLDGNKWLVTALSGSDIAKVIEYVLGGKPEFEIEEGNK